MKHTNETKTHLRNEHMTGDGDSSAQKLKDVNDGKSIHQKNKKINKRKEEEEDDLMKRSDFKYYYTWRKLL